MAFPKLPKGSSSPMDNQFTLFLFVVGVLSSIFVMVGNFGVYGVVPYALIVGGYVIQSKLKFRSEATSVTGFSSKSLTFIAGGLILILAINYMLSTFLSVAFLQPPLSATSLASSAPYGNMPVYVYSLLFAISEEYMFRAVILYWLFNSKVVPNGFARQLFAVAGSSLAWMIFHLFVYGTQPLVLAFVFFAGVVFGFVTLYSRNILVASSVHGINNLIAAGLTIAKVVV